MNRLAPAALAALCFAAPSLARDREAVPEATPIGKPVSCLTLNQVRETRVHGDSVIDFHTNGNKVFRNTLPISCPMLGFEERFLYKTSTSQICSVDIITVLESPGLTQGPSCGLGQFQQVELVKVAKTPR